MTERDDDSAADADVERIFLEHIGGDHAEDIEDLVRRHPEREVELRSLHADWIAARRVLMDDVSETVDVTTPDNGSWDEFLARLRRRISTANRYEMRSEIARGGMGVVHRVYDNDLQRPLAMKVILGRGDADPTGATPKVDERTIGRFIDEARVTGRLDHPGIVPVHEVGVDDGGHVFFTMKLVQGEELTTVIEKLHAGDPEWSLTRVVGLLLRVCEAMSFAHDKGVLHRDLKPSNVMVGRFGEVYVMDWGLARILARASVTDAGDPGSHASATGSHPDPDVGGAMLTREGDVLGTPSYMAPEQARGEVASLTPRTDVYSIGAILYYVLSGHAPYQGRRAIGAFEVLEKLLAGPPHRVGRSTVFVPAALVSICEKAMARSARDRYASAQDLASDLRSYLENRVVHAHRTGPLAELRAWVSRNRGVTAAVVAAILVCLAVGVLAYDRVATERDAASRLAERNDALARNERAARRRADAGETEARHLLGVATLERARMLEREGRLQEACLLAGRSVGFALMGGPFAAYPALLRPGSPEGLAALETARRTAVREMWRRDVYTPANARIFLSGDERRFLSLREVDVDDETITVARWDARTGEAVDEFPIAGFDGIDVTAITELDDRVSVLGTDDASDGRSLVWRRIDGTVRAFVGTPACHDLSVDGRLVGLVVESEVRLHDHERMDPLWTARIEGGLQDPSIRVCPAGSVVIVAGRLPPAADAIDVATSTAVFVSFDLRTGERIGWADFPVHEAPVWTISRAGRVFASLVQGASTDSVVELSGRSLEHVATIPCGREYGGGRHAPSVLTFHDGRRRLAVSNGSDAVVVDVETGKTLFRGELSSDSLVFSPEGSRLVGSGWWAVVDLDTRHGSFSRRERIDHVRFTSDGGRLVVAANDGRIHLVDASGGETIRSYPATGSRVRHMALHPDDRRLVLDTYGDDVGAGGRPDSSSLRRAGGRGRRCSILDLTSGALHASPVDLDASIDFTFEPVGATLVSLDEDGVLRTFDSTTWDLVDETTLAYESAIDSGVLASDREGRLAVALCTITGPRELAGPEDPEEHVRQWVAFERGVSRWSSRLFVLDGEQTEQFDRSSGVSSLAFDGDRLVIGCDLGQIVVRDRGWREVVREFRTTSLLDDILTARGCGDLVVHRSEGEPTKLSAPDGTRIAVLDDGNHGVEVAPDGRGLVTYGESLVLYDVGAISCPSTSSADHEIEEVSATLGHAIVERTADGDLDRYIADLDAHGRVDPSSVRVLPDDVYGGTFSTCGDFVLCSDDDGFVVVPVVDDQEPIRVGSRHGLDIWFVGGALIDVSPDGATLVVADADAGRIEVWDVRDPHRPRRRYELNIHGPERVAFASRNTMIVATAGLLWHIDLDAVNPTPQRIEGASGPFAVHSRARLVAWQGSRSVRIASSDGLDSPAFEFPVPGPIKAIAFDPGAAYLVVGAGMTWLLDLGSGAAIASVDVDSEFVTILVDEDGSVSTLDASAPDRLTPLFARFTREMLKPFEFRGIEVVRHPRGFNLFTGNGIDARESR